MSPSIKSDGVLERVTAKLAQAPQWMPQIYIRHMPNLGGQIADIMEGVLENNRYTGALQGSITSTYDPSKAEVAIRPTAQRGGRWDAGALLELGTGPIPRLPWAPIKAWAEFRGIPAFPVWWKIKTQGVSPHPFLQRTLDDGQSKDAVNEAAVRIITDAALEVVQDSGVSSIGLQVNR